MGVHGNVCWKGRKEGREKGKEGTQRDNKDMDMGMSMGVGWVNRAKVEREKKKRGCGKRYDRKGIGFMQKKQ